MFAHKSLVFWFISIYTSLSLAQTNILTLDSVWSQVDETSLAQESGRAQVESLKITEAKSKRHWYPRVYLNAQTYKTNDPGASFFGLIQQRALESSDFSSSFINQPDSEIYTRGSLGLDLPLYEGGIRSSQKDMVKLQLLSSERQNQQIKIDQFASVAKYYGLIQSFDLTKQSLIKLKETVNLQLKKYQLGSKSNPVGYSGLLGMKSLVNRIQGLINQLDGQVQGYKKSLNEMGLKNLSWSTESKDTLSYIEQLSLDTNINSEKIVNSDSYKIESLNLSSNAIDLSTKFENAKFLPQVGAFAEGYVFNGPRDTADGYTAGLYLRWNLYDPNVHGSVKEAKLKSLAYSKSIEAMAQFEKAEKVALIENLKSIKQNYELIKDSDKLLIDLIKTSQTLFNNGSINALQMTEVLNRRVELILQMNQLEAQMIEITSQLLSKTKYKNSKYSL